MMIFPHIVSRIRWLRFRCSGLRVKPSGGGILLLMALAFFCSFCQGRNRLHLDEEALREELAAIPVASSAEGTVDTSRPKVPRQPIDRSVDASAPPVLIDLPSVEEASEMPGLSDVAHEVVYIKLQSGAMLLTDSMATLSFTMSGSSLICSNGVVVASFSMEGRFIERLASLGSEAVPPVPAEMFGSMAKDVRNARFINQLEVTGSGLYAHVYDGPTNRMRLYEIPPLQGEPAIQQIRTQESAALPVENMRRAGTVFPRGRLYMLDSKHLLATRRGGSLDDEMASVVSIDGDTIGYANYPEKIGNWTHSVIRGGESGASVRTPEGLVLHRPPYSDTVFEVHPPAKMVPRYILTLSGRGVSRNEGMSPGFDLKDRLLHGDLCDAGGFLFIKYTQNYDCPNTRNAKTLSMFRVVYNKQTRKALRLPASRSDYGFGLPDDLNGGLPVWPMSNFMSGRNLVTPVSLSELKQHLASRAFQVSSAPAARKEAFTQFVASLRDEDIIVRVVRFK